MSSGGGAFRGGLKGYDGKESGQELGSYCSKYIGNYERLSTLGSIMGGLLDEDSRIEREGGKDSESKFAKHALEEPEAQMTHVMKKRT